MNDFDSSRKSSTNPVETPFWVGNNLVEPQLNQVTRNGDVQHVEHQVMRVLTLLAAQPNQPLSREEILNVVWAGTTPNDEGLTQAICKLRKVLGDQPGEETVIQTIRKIGYRLVAQVSPEPGGVAPKAHVFDFSGSDKAPTRHIRIRLNARWALAAAALVIGMFAIAVLV